MTRHSSQIFCGRCWEIWGENLQIFICSSDVFCSWLGIDFVLHWIDPAPAEWDAARRWLNLVSQTAFVCVSFLQRGLLHFQLVAQLIWQSLLTLYSLPSLADNRTNSTWATDAYLVRMLNYICGITDLCYSLSWSLLVFLVIFSSTLNQIFCPALYSPPPTPPTDPPTWTYHFVHFGCSDFTFKQALERVGFTSQTTQGTAAHF